MQNSTSYRNALKGQDNLALGYRPRKSVEKSNLSCRDSTPKYCIAPSGQRLFCPEYPGALPRALLCNALGTFSLTNYVYNRSVGHRACTTAPGPHPRLSVVIRGKKNLHSHGARRPRRGLPYPTFQPENGAPGGLSSTSTKTQLISPSTSAIVSFHERFSSAAGQHTRDVTPVRLRPCRANPAH